MAKKMGKRIYREATADERKRHEGIRQQVRRELPAIKRRGRQKLAQALHHGIAIQHMVSALKAERIKKGLSLADIRERSGIQRSTLSRLENNVEPNPTLSTLTKYADAVGKKVLIILDEAEA